MRDHGGFSLVELMVAIAILVAMIGGVYVSVSAGQNSWANTALQISLQENIRVSLERISKEMRESGSNSVGAMQITINDNTGTNGSDVIQFFMPVECEAGTPVIDGNGDVAYWGAPLTWGCSDSTCMDADNDCTTVEYSYLEYAINNNNQLERRVRDGGNALVRTDVFARNISDMQAVLSGDQNVVTVTVTASGTTTNNRALSMDDSMDILLRNRG
ncbi:MAG: prepilin-type N-terminal cleavage/methylation domain-containing protein [Candidatus Omnitrophica bacterium]|nr:prepilin-type N-terminal cleavage/methylation domain-containing protein [Candidatus Omnitrophota bacterium]